MTRRRSGVCLRREARVARARAPDELRHGPSAFAGTRAARPEVRPPCLGSSARAARGAGLWSDAPSAGLPMRSVVSAPTAVLAYLEPVGRVPLRLRAHIVAPLALVAGERDLVSYSSSHFLFTSLEEGARRDKAPCLRRSESVAGRGRRRGTAPGPLPRLVDELVEPRRQLVEL